MDTLIDKKLTYAIIGASNNKEKYGHKVLRSLYEAGFKVIPINPKSGTILGLKVYENLDLVEDKIDVAVFVIPPNVTEEVIKEVINKNIKKVWLQPGSENENVLKFCAQHDLTCYHNACIMIEQLKYLK